MKKLRRNKNPADFDADLELPFQIYVRPYMGYKEMNDGTSEIHLQG